MVELSESFYKQLIMLDDVISNLELSELKLDVEHEGQVQLDNRMKELKDLNRIKRLDKTNIRDFKNNKRENDEKRLMSKVNKTLTKVIYKGNDYENITNSLSETGDEGVVRITQKLQEVLHCLPPDRKMNKNKCSLMNGGNCINMV